MQTDNSEGQHESDFSSWNDTTWRTPVSDDHKKNDRRCNKGKPYEYHRNQGDIQRNFVIADTMIFQILDLVFGFSGFETHRTKMPVVEVNVA